MFETCRRQEELSQNINLKKCILLVTFTILYHTARYEKHKGNERVACTSHILTARVTFPRTHPNARTQMHPLTIPNTRTHASSQKHAPTPTHAPKITHPRTHPNARPTHAPTTRTKACTHHAPATHPRTHPNAHTHARTQTHTPTHAPTHARSNKDVRVTPTTVRFICKISTNLLHDAFIRQLMLRCVSTLTVGHLQGARIFYCVCVLCFNLCGGNSIYYYNFCYEDYMLDFFFKSVIWMTYS